MVLADADIEKFQALYKSQFGMAISKEEAYEKGIKLLNLLSVIYKPMTEKEYDLVQKRRLETLPLLIEKITHP